MNDTTQPSRREDPRAALDTTPSDSDARALDRALDELRSRPDRIAALEAADRLTAEQRAELAVLTRLESARAVRLAPYRAAWRRECRERALERTGGARARAGTEAAA